MIDIHCHILPGIDDGPSGFSQAVKMAKIAVRDGISKIVATPHIVDDKQSIENINKCLNQLNSLLKEQNIELEVIKGGENSAILDPSLFKNFTISNTSYVLIEFPHSHLPKSAIDILFRIKNAGYSPIISHPERNQSIIENPELLLKLLDVNVLVQVTADSLTGEFGREIKMSARYLLKKGVVNVLATDAHDASFRKPILSAGLKAAAKILGKEKASRLVYKNPAAIIRGIPIYQKI